jgi:hypothetical protein
MRKHRVIDIKKAMRIQERCELSVEEMERVVQTTIKRGDRAQIEDLLDVCRQAAYFGRRVYPEKMSATQRFIKALEEALERLEGGEKT